MMLRRPAGGRAAVELARETALYEAARAAALLSCSEACRAASARQGFRASWCREPGLPAGTRRRRHAPAGIAARRATAECQGD
jgi:hypothetical protein